MSEPEVSWNPIAIQETRDALAGTGGSAPSTDIDPALAALAGEALPSTPADKPKGKTKTKKGEEAPPAEPPAVDGGAVAAAVEGWKGIIPPGTDLSIGHELGIVQAKDVEAQANKNGASPGAGVGDLKALLEVAIARSQACLELLQKPAVAGSGWATILEEKLESKTSYLAALTNSSSKMIEGALAEALKPVGKLAEAVAGILPTTSGISAALAGLEAKVTNLHGEVRAIRAALSSGTVAGVAIPEPVAELPEWAKGGIIQMLPGWPTSVDDTVKAMLGEIDKRRPDSGITPGQIAAFLKEIKAVAEDGTVDRSQYNMTHGIQGQAVR